MILNGNTIEELKLVQGTKWPGQFQPAGVDLSVESVWCFEGPGTIDGDNKLRKLPPTSKIEWKAGPDGSASLELPPGPYKVIFNETVSIPADAAAIARTRSSLLRSGVSVQTAVWDPGYTGRSEALLVVSNPAGFILHKDAKLIQLVFIRLERKAQMTYQGQYQGENVEKR